MSATQAGSERDAFASIAERSRKHLQAEEEAFRRGSWDSRQIAFVQQAHATLDGKICKRWEGRRRLDLPVPDSVHETVRLYNRSQSLLNYDAPRFQSIIADAIYRMANIAVTLRVVCSAVPERCAELMGHWPAAWCLMLRRFRRAASTLSSAGRVRSALGTSTAALIMQALPRELLFPLSALASGKAPMATSIAAVENVSVIFMEYFEVAQLLGKEMLHFGDRRVQRAVFHGEASNLGVLNGTTHRSDVLLWALAQSQLARKEQPQVVEVGVDHAECSARLLESHPGLRWLGVDLYISIDVKGPTAGGRALTEARATLKPWLGSRAQLLLDHSDAAASSWAGRRMFDLAFIDADHHEEPVKRDIAAWTPLLRPGGVMAGHDYAAIWPGVVQAAHSSLPANTTLHVAPDMVFWWYKPESPAWRSRSES